MSLSDLVRIVGPFSQYLCAVERSLLAQGYTRFSVKNRLGWTAQLSRWLHARGTAAHAVTELELQKFVRARRRCAPNFRRGSLDCIVKCLTELDAMNVPHALAPTPPARVDQALAAFANYLQQERALKNGPSPYTKTIRRFLVYRFGSRTPRPHLLVAKDLTAFMLRDFRRYSVGSAKFTVTALRSYVRFLHLTGVIDHDLTGAIPAISGWRLLGIPQGIPSQSLNKLLRSPDRRSRSGRRDYAILLLLARLGLRRHEVASLTLEDIDWERSELRIVGKGNKLAKLPLSSELGTALASHLCKRDPRQPSRAVFLRVRPPFRSLTPGGISGVVLQHCLRANLPPIGAHQLRHTVATQVLRQGGSLDEVAQLLRHSSHDTTAIYAKVDLKALRAVVRAWPEAKTGRPS